MSDKPTDAEIIEAMMKWNSGTRCVTYVVRNYLGRKRCSTAFIRARLQVMQVQGKVRLADRQDRGGMQVWEVVNKLTLKHTTFNSADDDKYDLGQMGRPEE